MAARRRLGKHQPVVHGHLEPPTGRWDELDARARELPAKLGRQTGGPGLVVSDDAILYDGAHARSPRPIGGGGGGSNRSGGWAGLPGVASVRGVTMQDMAPLVRASGRTYLFWP